MTSTLEDFREWLNSEALRLGLSYSEIARRGGVSPALISQLASGDTNPGDKSCTAISRAFGIPLDEVYRRAGLLPKLPETEYDKQSLWLRFIQLSPDRRQLLFRTIEAWVEEERELRKTKPKEEST